ncbi:MAG: efflux RND transporter permease subunit [Candidatus Binatia bacterium]
MGMMTAGMWTVPQRYPRTMLLIVAAITLVLGVFAARFGVDSAVDQLLPEHDPDGAYYETVRQAFGSEEIAVVGLFADDVFAAATLARIDRMTRELAAIPGVQDVTSLTNLERVTMGDEGLSREPLMPPLPLDAAQVTAFRARALADRLGRGAVVSADGRAAGVWVRFHPMPDEAFIARGLEERLRQVVAANPGDEAVAITGLPTIKVQAARNMIEDLALFVPLALLLVIGVLVWAFRTWRGLLLPLASVVIGLTWTIGIMVLAGDAFTMGSLVLPPLIMSSGVAYAIHVVSRYYIEVRPGRSHADAVSHAMAHVRLPVFMAALTTLIGFATFVTSPIPSIRDFGFYAALGIAVVFVACLVVVPAALALMPPPRTVPARLEEGGWFADFVAACGSLSMRHRWFFLPLFIALLAIGAVGMTKLRVETDYLRFFSPSHPVRIDNRRVSESLAGTQVVAVVVDAQGPEGVTRSDTIEAMRGLQHFIEQQPGVDRTLSLLDQLDSVRTAVSPARVGAPFTDQAEIAGLLNLLAPRDVRHEVNPDHSRAQITVHTSLSSSQEVGDFVARVEAYGARQFPAGVAVRATGTVVLLNRSADALAWSQVWGDAQVMAILLLLMVLLLRSLRLGLLSMVPNVLPIVLLFGIMGYAGIDLNICTSTIASISIGIAVDDTIHYMLGFYDELRTGSTREEAILATLRGVGRPILITSVALTAAFLIVCISNFQPVRHFGLLAGCTMVIGVFTDLFLLPALLITLPLGERAAAVEAVREPAAAAGEGS